MIIIHHAIDLETDTIQCNSARGSATQVVIFVVDFVEAVLLRVSSDRVDRFLTNGV